MNSTLFPWLGLFMAAAPLQATQLLDEPFLDSLRAEAVRHHPAAAAAGHRTAAAEADVRSVRLWDDPSIGLSLMAAETMKRRDDGDVRLGFEQPLPRPGLYEAARGKAESMRRAEAENTRTSSLEVAAAAVRDAVELGLADESITLQAAQLEWLSAMAGNARQRVINPDGNSVEALRLQGELSRETQVLEAAKRSREALAKKLNLRLGRAIESPWPTLKLPDSALPVPVASAEIARIPHANPKMRSMKELASASGQDTRIAESERKPGLSVSVESGFYSGGDFRDATVGLKMSMPWFNDSSYQARVDAARSREKAAGQDIEAIRLEVAEAVLTAATEAANAGSQARAYAGDVFKSSQEAKQSVESAWISSKASLTDLLEANRALFSIRLEQRRAVAMQQVALEELRILVPPPISSKR